MPKTCTNLLALGVILESRIEEPGLWKEWPLSGGKFLDLGGIMRFSRKGEITIIRVEQLAPLCKFLEGYFHLFSLFEKRGSNFDLEKGEI